MLSCCQIHDKENYLRSPLLLTAAAALPPEFLQQWEHQIEAMGHVEPGENPRWIQRIQQIYSIYSYVFLLQGKDGGEQISANTLMDEKLPRPMLNKLPRKASGSLLSLLAGPSVASNASTVIPDTACSWTFLPAIMSSLDHPGKATKQVVSLGKEGVKQKVEQSGFWYPTRIKHAQKVQLRVTWFFFNLSQAMFQLFLMLMRCFCL